MTQRGSSHRRTADARLRVLGGFRLHIGDAGLTTVSRVAQRLLAFLAVHHERPAPRHVLWERLWPEADAAHASSSLRTTLYRLPRVDGHPLVTNGSGHLHLDERVSVDLWECQEQVRALEEVADGDALPDRERWRELFDLDLLPGWYDEWLLVEQESHRQLRLHALELLSGRLRQAGDVTAALLTGLAAVAAEPLRESAHRRVIDAHLAEGNHAEALRQYDSYRRLLARELGLPPSPEIRQLVGPLLGRPLGRRRTA